MSPHECLTSTDVLSMQSTYKELGSFSLLIRHDGAVILTEQNPGQPKKASITIPRRTFQALLRWYHEPQTRSAQ